jgi:hypothetical protein
MLARVLESISFLRKWERTKAAAEVPIWNQKQKVVPGKLVPLRYSQYLLSVHIARIVSSVRIRDSKFNYFKVTKNVTSGISTRLRITFLLNGIIIIIITHQSSSFGPEHKPS